MEIKQQTDFINENRVKLTEYVKNIEIIARDVPRSDFEPKLKLLTDKNPKVDRFWNMMSSASFMSRIMGTYWWELAKWESIIDCFEPEFIQIIEHFKTLYPNLF